MNGYDSKLAFVDEDGGLAFALLFVFAGTGLLIYLLLWIFVPLE